FHAGLLDTADELSAKFARAAPFGHLCITPFCDEELLQGVRHEMLEHLHFTQKETDIFRYHQSGDLANLDGLPVAERKRLPHLQRLRDAIYSQEFRDFVSRATGCGPLSGTRTDMSTNRYKKGDHLLLHDDAIGDRRVSYIIYLPDPDYEWLPEDGGHLELYARASATSWAPAISPTRRLVPRWNQIVVFPVLPGESHHAVEEVAGAGRERLSIQGWFHFPQPGEPGYAPDQMAPLWRAGAVSTLGQIEARRQRAAGCAGDAFTPFAADGRPIDAGAPLLSAADHSRLASHLNADYLDARVMQQAAARFAQDSHIQLGAFLNGDTTAALLEALRGVDAHDGVGSAAGAGRIPPHGTGERGRWHAFGPPVIRRFMRLDGPLLAALRDLFASPAYARWLSAITALALSAQRGMVRRFRPGLDYTLGSPDGSTAATLDAVLCLAHSSSAWADGAVGGYECYVDAGGDDDEASNDGSVYRLAEEDDGILLTTPAAWNTLNVAMREPSIVKFVKYVSASAPCSRWDVSFEYSIPADDNDND
ncbi:Oxoglutarate and iron-dependent oxygenase degradation C-term-domain-containing protein, partial [Coemansia spiralis]